LAARRTRAAVGTAGDWVHINGGTADGAARNAAAFRKGLNETGYDEGQNVIVESSFHFLRSNPQRSGSKGGSIGQIACTIGIEKNSVINWIRWYLVRIVHRLPIRLPTYCSAMRESFGATSRHAPRNTHHSGRVRPNAS